LESVLRSARRASGLTQQLRTISRRETSGPTTVIDARDLIIGLSELLRLLPSNITVVQEVSDVVIPIRGHRDALDLALTNRVLKARDAMPDGGQLRLSTRQVVLKGPQAQPLALAPGAYLRLEVQDSGEGMDEATQEKVFEPFF